jgi:hypothetical protein
MVTENFAFGPDEPLTLPLGCRECCAQLMMRTGLF